MVKQHTESMPDEWLPSFTRKPEQTTISLDGKQSFHDRDETYGQPLHIISAQICELGITWRQNGSNQKQEIPAAEAAGKNGY